MLQTVPAIDLLFCRHILSNIMAWITPKQTPDRFDVCCDLNQLEEAA